MVCFSGSTGVDCVEDGQDGDAVCRTSSAVAHHCNMPHVLLEAYPRRKTKAETTCIFNFVGICSGQIRHTGRSTSRISVIASNAAITVQRRP